MAAINSIYQTANPPGSPSDGVAVTGTNTYRSKAFEIPTGQPVGLHIQWTETAATLTGAFTLWYTNKLGAVTTDDNDWIQDTSFPAPAVSGSGKVYITIANATALGVRLKYVNATGSGSIVAYVAIPRAGN